MKTFKIKIMPQEKEILYVNGENLLYTLVSNGINIYASCGGDGVCGKCKVKILKGKYLTPFSEHISEEERKQNITLACLTKIESDVEIEILENSKVDNIKILDNRKLNNTVSSCCDIEFSRDIDKIITTNLWSYEPVVKTVSVELKEPSLDNPISDIDRLLDVFEKNVVLNDLDLIRYLPVKMREFYWKMYLVLAEQNQYFQIIDILKLEESSKLIYGLAVDVGTTTVVVSLVSLNEKKVLLSKTSLNQQASFGDDVITRIINSQKPSGLKFLHQKIIFTINNIINSIISETKISVEQIYSIVFSGNTVMKHFLYNISPINIRREPYVPVITKMPVIKAKDLNLITNSRAVVYSIADVASYVGGDIVSGVVSCGIDTKDELCVLLDLGTNGEIVVGNKEFLVCASCSAGPAFEGTGIKCGMRATSGAIEDIEIVGDKIEYKTIGNMPAVGICGSGLIAILPELFQSGIIDRSGKFVKLDEKFQKSLYNRIRINESEEKEFVIVEKKFSTNQKDIVITESDIANILRSKGAIFHGLHSLLKNLNLEFKDISKIYICGGFGSFVNIKKAKVLGLLPDVEDEKFIVAGNTSLLGAQLFLLSKEVRDKVEQVAKKMAYIDLSSQPFYMNEYTSSLFMPHTDLNLFPNISRIIKNA